MGILNVDYSGGVVVIKEFHCEFIDMLTLPSRHDPLFFYAIVDNFSETLAMILRAEGTYTTHTEP